MIYWVIFDGGIGGDGFVNMLEHASNIEPVDGILRWRNSATPSGKIKFTYPVWVQPSQWFRHHGDSFQYGIEQLTTTFVSLLEKNANVVIPIHKIFFEQMFKFKYQNVIAHPNKKICLYSNNINRVIEDFIDKQPDQDITPKMVEAQQKRSILNTTASLPVDSETRRTITFIDIDRSWSDWEYLNSILIKLNIDLPKKEYNSYLDISNRRTQK